jgi:VIT1/CCC1 family predicted Fe2+/Mn2+ transporter
MKLSYIKGLSFGLTSGIITTLGMMVGLNAGTHSKLAVLGGILTIAIADAFSDALGIHISEESENVHSHREIWESTFATFIAKLVFALTFVIPVLVFALKEAIWVSIGWGFFLLGILSFLMARAQKEPIWKIIGEHWMIALLVISITNWVGRWIAMTFGGLT